MIKQLIKKWFKLYDKQDIETALSLTPNAVDREDFIWKFEKELEKIFNQE